MAGETVVLTANEISQLIQYSSAFVVATITGVAGWLGWAKAKNVKPEEPAPAIPTSGSTNESLAQLSRAIHLLVDRLIEIHEDVSRQEKRERELTEELVDDMRRLIHQLRLLHVEKGV